MNQILDFEDNELKKNSNNSTINNTNSIANNNTEKDIDMAKKVVRENEIRNDYRNVPNKNNVMEKSMPNRMETPQFNNYRDYDMKKMS